MEDDPAGFDTKYLCHFVHQINSSGLLFRDDPLRYSVPLLLLQLSLLSIITRVSQFLLKPLGQPLIVSQILGGIILGPSVLGQNLMFLHKVFPTKARVILDTLSVFGMMFFSFLVGVKVDPSMILRSGKKPFAVGVLGFFIPYGFASLVAFLLINFSSLDNTISRVLPRVVVMQSMTAYPGITYFLDDLKILNSEIGRLASSSSIICDVCLWSVVFIESAIELAKSKPLKVTIGFFYQVSSLPFFFMFGVRPAALWTIRQTPEGKPVKEIHIFIVLVLLMACGFTGEAIGVGAPLGSLALGLVIPDGPPLGAALVERLDCFVSVLLMPLFFASCGLHMDIFSIQKYKNVGLLQLIILVAFLGKIMGTMLPLLFCRMQFRDALSLGLIMNSKGIVELAMINNFQKSNVVSAESYAVLVVSVLFITGVVSPVVKALYDPSKDMWLTREELFYIAEEVMNSAYLLAYIIKKTLVQLSASSMSPIPQKESPINLVVLHLIRLMGRASSLLVAHRQCDEPSRNPTQSERIFNVFKKFEQQTEGLMMVNCYKGVSPYATMHNDVCSLALEKRTILIILPFHKQWEFGQRVESSYAYKHLNKNVLEKAPCSVGILVDRGSLKKSHHRITKPSLYRVAVLFFGGADDREALAYARRMVEISCVILTLIHFIALGTNGVVGGSERSKMLDAEILGDLKSKMQITERISYQEEVVTNGTDVTDIINSLGNTYNLVMVGRRHGDSQIMFQLSKYKQRGELGAVGEILASSDFKGENCALVVQQQTKLWGLKDPEESTHLRRINL